MPFSKFLARIREKIPAFQDGHYERIAKAFQDGHLHVPHQPMSDAELGRTIATFLKIDPSEVSIEELEKQLNR